MRAGSQLLTLLLVIAAVPSFAEGPGGAPTRLFEPDDLQDYCEKCYQRMGITAAKVEAKFSGKCNVPLGDNAKYLYTSQGGYYLDLIYPDGEKNEGGASNFPADCDRPAWLDLPAGGHKCYGHTRIQKFEVEGDSGEVTGVLLCRHKKIWNSEEATYDDIAMILHCKQNGQTCWFQSKQTEGLDGDAVPLPHTYEGTIFWLRPSSTAAINCIRCHDNGPWMNSRWMDNSGIKLEDHRGPYVNKGAGFAENWKDPKFITVGNAELDGSIKSCTGCHKMHQADKTKVGAEPYQNAAKWIDFSVGTQYPPQCGADSCQKFGIAYWMPEDHGLKDADGWRDKLKQHVDAVRACCQKQGKKDAKFKADPCECFPKEACKPAPEPRAKRAPSLSPGVSIAAEVEGLPYECSAPPDCNGGIYSVIPGSTVFLSWEADSLHPVSVFCTGSA